MTLNPYLVLALDQRALLQTQDQPDRLGGRLSEVGQELLHEYAHVGKRRALVSPGRGSLIIRFAVNQHPQLCALPLGKTVILTAPKVSRAQLILCAQKLPTQFTSMSTWVPSSFESIKSLCLLSTYTRV